MGKIFFILVTIMVMIWSRSPEAAEGTTINHFQIPYVDSESPAVKRDRRVKYTPADLKRECPHHKPQEAFWVVERDGRWMLVDPLISQQLH